MRFIKSLLYAIQGIKNCATAEKNFRTQLVIATITLLCGFVCNISATEWLAVLFCCALVLSLEMINSAIEKLSDIVTTSIHPGIKKVKDIAAGAVCVASLISFITGCIIFFPKFKSLIQYLVK